MFNGCTFKPPFLGTSTPPLTGKELAHAKGKRAKDGYGYEHSNIQDADLHKIEHKYEGY
ncbi:polymorphic toxin type 8 domain-containing protein [Desulfopila sp. IMCC35008]|uniref:polymorphic toxin type 8 domain-containing protein n=1 Tax=Desulfopila sp. IMCC35008 TaxID=2653858 RepID=UPI00197AB4E2